MLHQLSQVYDKPQYNVCVTSGYFQIPQNLNSYYRVLFPCLTDKCQPNDLPDTLPVLCRTPCLGEV